MATVLCRVRRCFSGVNITDLCKQVHLATFGLSLSLKDTQWFIFTVYKAHVSKTKQKPGIKYSDGRTVMIFK